MNVPLKEGMDDMSYEYIFTPIMQMVMDFYKPSAVVLQVLSSSLDCSCQVLYINVLKVFNCTPGRY